MRKTFAFRLCGELAELGLELSPGIEAGNTALVCVTAGLELLDLASSAVGLYGEKKRTQTMAQGLQRAERQYAALEAKKQEQAEAILEAELGLSQERIRQQKLQLERERDALRTRLEESATRTQYLNQEDLRKSELARRVRDRTKETIRLVGGLLQNPKFKEEANYHLARELEEQFRVATEMYTKFVKLCC